jgi:5-methylcytosine-specific restriction endonuclease McrA
MLEVHMQVLKSPPSDWRALVLNADFRPLSYYPLSTKPWQDVVKAVFEGRVDVVSTYDIEIHSPSIKMRLPSVVALKTYIDQNRPPAFTRYNVFLRDEFSCQYCGIDEDLTFDHVVPVSQGGKSSWTNILTACAPCNLRKGGKTPQQARMMPAKNPPRPTMYQLQELGRRFPPNYLHESWIDYLYWDTLLEG